MNKISCKGGTYILDQHAYSETLDTAHTVYCMCAGHISWTPEETGGELLLVFYNSRVSDEAADNCPYPIMASSITSIMNAIKTSEPVHC